MLYFDLYFSFAELDVFIYTTIYESTILSRPELMSGLNFRDRILTLHLRQAS